MTKLTFGTKQQVSFNSEADYYEFLGYLSKNDGSSKIVWERNDLAGAWEQEGRIHFFTEVPDELNAILTHTAGVGNIVTRVNCNEFVNQLIDEHSFVFGSQQDLDKIMTTIPDAFIEDFERGLDL